MIFGHPWHYYVVMFIILLTAQILRHFMLRKDEYKYATKFKRFVLMSFCWLPGLVFIGFPYKVWEVSGFHERDAREAEQLMVNRYVQQGAQTVDARFIISDHSSMIGLINIQYPDGRVASDKCKAEKSDSGDEFLIFCNQP